MRSAPRAWNALELKLVSARTSTINKGAPEDCSARSSSIDIRSLSFAVALGRGAPSLVFGVAVSIRSVLKEAGGGVRPSNINEPPCRATESNTTRQQTTNNCSLPGTPTNTGSRIKSKELRPRGPNQAIKKQLRRSSLVRDNDKRNTIGRINTAVTAKSTVITLSTSRPCHMSELPNSMKVKSKVISAVVWPYSRKQSHSSTSRAAIVNPAQKAAKKPLPWTASAAA